MFEASYLSSVVFETADETGQTPQAKIDPLCKLGNGRLNVPSTPESVCELG